MENRSLRFELIGDSTRMQILKLLGDSRSLRAKDILEHLPISQPTLSHHMHILTDEDLVEVRKVGRECFYSIHEAPFQEMIEELSSLISEKKKEPSEKPVKVKKEKKEKKKKKKEKKEK